jgi:cytoskeletal protein CcmA (bactofilin family)
MSIGGKKQNEQLRAYLGQDAVFEGTMNFEGTVRIDGKFEGEIFSNDTLIIGETGELTAEITAGTVICKGKVNGTILASKRIEIHSQSRVVGNIKAPSLYVEVGALFDGSCDMSGAEGKIIKLVKGEEKTAGGK